MGGLGLRRVALWAIYLAVLWSWHSFLQATWTVPKGPPPMDRSGAQQLTPPSPPHRIAQQQQQQQLLQQVVQSVTLASSPPPPPQQRTSFDVNAATCTGSAHTEYDGAVMVPGSGAGATVSKSPADCCALCARTRGCNIWVACTHSWCGNQCWLKWTDDPSKPTVRAKGGETPWTSGSLRKDVPADQPVPSEAALNSTRIVSLQTTHGALRIRLRPDWHVPSVRFVQAAALGDFCTVKCELYRAEPGFLLQGAMRALVEPNKRCRKFRGGPKECEDPEERPGGAIMNNGDVAWAGGSAGPDFFILLGRNGFGATHTVWGSLADEESMALALKLVRGKSSSAPGTMRILDEPVRFTMTKVS